MTKVSNATVMSRSLKISTTEDLTIPALCSLLHRLRYLILDTQHSTSSRFILPGVWKSGLMATVQFSCFDTIPNLCRTRFPYCPIASWGNLANQHQQVSQICHPLPHLLFQTKAFRMAAMLQSENKLTRQQNLTKISNGLPLQKGSSKIWRDPT